MTFPHFDFATAWVLPLLLVLPLWWWRRRRHRPPAITFSRVELLARGPKAGRGVARTIFVARNVAIAGAILALARPRAAGRAEQSTTEGINVIVAFDISS